MKANAEIIRQSHGKIHSNTATQTHTRALTHTGASAKGEEGESGQLTATGEIKKKAMKHHNIKG